MHHFHISRVVVIVCTFVLMGSGVAADAQTSCGWTQLTASGETHHSFLRTGGQSGQVSPPAARLYHAVLAADGALLRCSWVDDAAVLDSYLSRCLDKAAGFEETRGAPVFDTSLLHHLCDAMHAPAGAEGARAAAWGSRKARSVEGARSADRWTQLRAPATSHLRVKRGFIVPGTLWCGSGNKALSYEDLGVFTRTDSCCREHDQCQNTILSFQSKFGVFNRNMFTMSHCDCDNRFHSCLRKANDSISEVVRYTFFNLLKMNCFELAYEVVCMERNWFGMCKTTETVLQAIVQPPTDYELDAFTSEENATEATALLSITPPTTLAFVADTSRAVGIGVSAPTSESSASLTASSNNSSLDRPNLFAADSDKPSLSNGWTANISQQLLCEVYSELDQCRARIRPQQRRYGLVNPDTRTMYHCSCTNRLFQSLANQRWLSNVDTFLLEKVSQSCFLVPDCGASKICKAIVQRPPLPTLVRTLAGGNMEEWRRLLATRLQVRASSSLGVKRKDRVVRLRRLCERITRTKAMTALPGAEKPDRNGPDRRNMAHFSLADGLCLVGKLELNPPWSLMAQTA
ncbi:Group 3 secretory phospholipase A2 [Merluccius polli]|uniref:phospholipase A2 n=1 Tax=Merluccius polli TaxID=89951 RepID=A0AA47P805_MERPO|nr:Group 3 secretory phospholipase A2 [Merluccius polli]